MWIEVAHILWCDSLWYCQTFVPFRICIHSIEKISRDMCACNSWSLKLSVFWPRGPKKSHKTKNTIFDLYRGHGPISLASEAGHCSNLKIVPDLASLDRFKFFQWFLCIIFNPLSPPNASSDLKIFNFHTVFYIVGAIPAQT